VITHDRVFIGGQWVASSGSATIEVVNPATEQVVGRVPDGSAADMARAVAAARHSFELGPWRSVAHGDRADVVAALAAVLKARSGELASLITAEMGAPVKSCAAINVVQPMQTLQFFAGLGRTYAFEEMRIGKRSSLLVHEPVGVVAIIVPWNAPLRSIVNKLAPALIAGCSVVVKPAPETPLDAFWFADVLNEVGVPAGVVNIVPAGREAGDALVRSNGIDKVAFTGSTAAGRAIMAAASARVTRVKLELGGKSAAIVCDDAELDSTVTKLAPMIFGMTGQACVAQSRVLVSRRNHDALVERFCAAAAAQRVGDPLDPATDLGPLVSSRQRDRVEGYVALARQEGARVACGGGRPAGLDRGWYVEPTVLVDVENSMRVAREEIFGPVVSIIAYDDVDDAVAMANDSEYGLSGSVWSADHDVAVAIARRIRTGNVSINGAAQASEAPFGGFKQSGFGKEYGPEGLREYLETKAIAVDQ
jgi:aldehyde dehydrogenase (NAD+)